MPTVTKYAQNMQFSARKILMELIGDFCGDVTKVSFKVEENTQGREDGIYRNLSILYNGAVMVNGPTQAVVYEELRKLIRPQRLKR